VGNPHVLAYVRQHGHDRVLILASFTEQPQTIPANEFRLQGLTGTFTDLVSGKTLEPGFITRQAVKTFYFVRRCTRIFADS
jgi:hypothetical protein